MTDHLTPTIANQRYQALRQIPKPTPMRTTDGQGYSIAGSRQHEDWPPRGRLFRTICPDPELLGLWHPRWYDHPRIERERRGPTRYVCHPYVLDSAAFRDFHTLEAAGWRVLVTGQSVYYPGNTVRVEIWRKS